MGPRLLRGKDVADALDAATAARVEALLLRGIGPTLAVVRVGEAPSDIAYERSAVKRAAGLGIQTEKFLCPADLETEDLVAVLESINANNAIHGVLLLQPLPDRMDAVRVRNAIAPEKDLDCVSDRALGQFFAGQGGFAPCTAQGCMELLRHYEIPVRGRRAVVIGRSMVIGRPVARLLLDADATVTVCHTKTAPDTLRAVCREADLLVSAAGHMGTVRAEMTRPGQTVVDVGVNFDSDGHMAGDVDFDPVCGTLGADGAVTPVPGGVGSVTTSVLLSHLATAAERQL